MLIISNTAVEVMKVKLSLELLPLSLKLTFRQYPAMHTNYIISHCTTLQYNHSI